jgi:ubiquitin-conjugating enzyme E2 J1
METDAKGQLGGLDVSAKEREKIATGTTGWRCGVCARTNGDILKESEEAAAEKAKEGGKVEEVEIPSELKMGWKDEMGQEKAKSAERDNDGETSAELAEGFVRTVDGAADAQPVGVQAPASAPVPVPTPTRHGVQEMGHELRARAQQAQQRVLQQPPRPAQVRSNDGVPMWIDRAIAGVVILLAAMFMKIILGL